MTLAPAIVSHLPDLRAYAALLSDNRADGEDLLQETVLRALERQDLWKPERGPLRAWLFAIMRNRAIDRARHRRRVRLIALDDAVLPSRRAAQEHAVHLREVAARIRKLPPQFRDVLVRRVRGDRTQDIARDLGIPPGSVTSRAWRARRRLRPAAL